MNLHFPKKYVASSDAVAQILRGVKTIAVVGLSSNPMRPSYGVAEYLKTAGYRIIPVNPNETEVLGEKAYARLEDIPEQVDIVDVFRRAGERPAVAGLGVRVGGEGFGVACGIE